MNRIKWFLLKQIAAAVCKQGHKHKAYITEYFRVLRVAAANEFTEDTVPGLDSFLNECFDDSKN